MVTQRSEKFTNNMYWISDNYCKCQNTSRVTCPQNISSRLGCFMSFALRKTQNSVTDQKQVVHYTHQTNDKHLKTTRSETKKL